MSHDVSAELDVPHRPDLTPVGRQLDALAPVAARFLVPDNATGRAALAGLVVAAEVRRQGHEAVAVLNARDRNTLGLRRDLLGLLALVHVVPAAAALGGSRVGIAGYLAGVASRVLAARRTGARALDGVVHPVSVLAVAALTADSWRARRAGTLRWRGRPVTPVAA